MFLKSNFFSRNYNIKIVLLLKKLKKLKNPKLIRILRLAHNKLFPQKSNLKNYVPSARKKNLEFLVSNKIVIFHKFFYILFLAHVAKNINNLFFVINGDVNECCCNFKASFQHPPCQSKYKVYW